MSTCSSCNADIDWVRTHPAGKLMPIDPVPVADGNIVKTGSTDERGNPVVVFLKPGEDRATKYRSHFSTCPNAAEHRQHGKR